MRHRFCQRKAVRPVSGPSRRADCISVTPHRHPHDRRQAQLSVDNWGNIEGYSTLFRFDRPVFVKTSWLPASGIRRDKLAMWIKSGSLHLDYEMPGRQLAWVRRADGSWVAVVELTALSGNERSSLTATLWLPPSAIRA